MTRSAQVKELAARLESLNVPRVRALGDEERREWARREAERQVAAQERVSAESAEIRRTAKELGVSTATVRKAKKEHSRKQAAEASALRAKQEERELEIALRALAGIPEPTPQNIRAERKRRQDAGLPFGDDTLKAEVWPTLSEPTIRRRRGSPGRSDG